MFAGCQGLGRQQRFFSAGWRCSNVELVNPSVKYVSSARMHPPALKICCRDS